MYNYYFYYSSVHQKILWHIIFNYVLLDSVLILKLCYVIVLYFIFYITYVAHKMVIRFSANHHKGITFQVLSAAI